MLNPAQCPPYSTRRCVYSSPSAFFFLFLFFLPVLRDRGCSRILRISSSTIFLSDFTLARSKAGGAPTLERPFLVMATINHLSAHLCLQLS